MKLIYVASPYKGDIKKNIEYAKQACRYILNEGNAFFCPHLLYPQILDDNRRLRNAKTREITGFFCVKKV
ncbi:DUF7768 domain-containing protein [Sedimentibacter saalensis]|uniref:DUF7768 domain-containing protein n=1 Tax=Sedimentibacter saalensis TaxID=130788 RepID=UPI00406B9155